MTDVPVWVQIPTVPSGYLTLGATTVIFAAFEALRAFRDFKNTESRLMIGPSYDLADCLRGMEAVGGVHENNYWHELASGQDAVVLFKLGKRRKSPLHLKTPMEETWAQLEGHRGPLHASIAKFAFNGIR